MSTFTGHDAAQAMAAAPSRGTSRPEFEPATILPVQLASSRMSDASLVPEKQLLLAVLEEAIGTFQRYVNDPGRRGRRLFREAEEWLLSDETGWPCSFCNICDVLSFDIDYLRGGLIRWRERQRAHPGAMPFRHPFRRLSGSRTRAVGRPIGLPRRVDGNVISMGAARVTRDGPHAS